MTASPGDLIAPKPTGPPLGWCNGDDEAITSEPSEERSRVSTPAR